MANIKRLSRIAYVEYYDLLNVGIRIIARTKKQLVRIHNPIHAVVIHLPEQ